MHGILCAGQQQPGSWSQKSEFSKIVSLLKFCTNFLFPVSPDITDTFLFNKVFDWSRFRASWAWVCVWRKRVKIFKKKVNFLKRDPFEKNPKRFFFLYPWGVLRLFYLINFLIGACLEPPGPGFVFGGKESKSSKKSEFSKKGPLVKNSKTFFFLVSLGCPETFLFYKIFGGSMFSRVWIRICVCQNSANFSKKQ